LVGKLNVKPGAGSGGKDDPSRVTIVAMGVIGWVILAVIVVVVASLAFVVIRRRRRGGRVIAAKEKV
jgi:hypothetical protein